MLKNKGGAMSEKILTIISTRDPEKARTGLMYSLNALKYGWMKEVRLYFFGPSQDLLLEDYELQDMLKQFHSLGPKAVACKFLSDEAETSNRISELDVKVEYVGSQISDLIMAGFVPMVW